MRTTDTSFDIHQTVVGLADAGRRFALVVLLEDAGSTPQKAGTKAIIEDGGALHGTIGGGLLEHQARLVAARAMASGRPMVFDFRFDGRSAREGDPVCGGSVRVLVDPAARGHRAAYAAAARARAERGRGTLFTSVRVRGDDTAEVDVRWAPAGAGGPADAAPAASDTSVHVLAEEIAPGPLLIVVGGGHVGQALARQAAPVGFEVVVIEDRPEFADPARFPGAAAVRCGDVAQELVKVPLDGDTFVALVSRGHRVDAQALAACVRNSALAYVGMMGSRRKVALLRKEFVESGLASEAEFDRVHAPIGLDIGAETVPEIAASIVAQLVMVLRQGRRERPDAAGRRKVALR